MRFHSLIPTALLLGLGASHPISLDLLKRTGENIDVTILQFALTLEHLENVFYKSALVLFSEDDFKKAGFGSHFFENLQFVVQDEQTHVTALTAAISAAGQTPVAACNYNFPFHDVNTFVTLSSVLEGVGTSAYLGAASLVTDKTILTTAASIMVTEALHTSQQRGELYLVPGANAFGTPVSANAIFTLAASFITDCPSTNMALPFTAFPSLTVDASGCGDNNGGGWNKWKGYKQRRTDGKGDDQKKNDDKKDDKKDDNNSYDDYDKYDQKYNAWKKGLVCPAPKVGEGARFHSDCDIPQGSFVTFVSGLVTISVQANIQGTVVDVSVPDTISGQTYVFITKTAISGMIMDGDVVSGPAILEVTPSPPVIDTTTFR